MRTLRTWLTRWRGLFRKEQMDRELEEEWASHLDMYIEENVRSGDDPNRSAAECVDKARWRRATKEFVREQRGIPLLKTLLRDASYGVRSFPGDSAGTKAAVRQVTHGVDPGLPMSDEQAARSIMNQRMVAQLSSFFGFLAVFLSCIGIYGLMSYLVTKRSNEIGLRMALGAESSQVMCLVMRESLLLVAMGIATGIPVGFVCVRLVSSMLYGVRVTDPSTVLAVAALLLVTAATAGYLPARRAVHLDPMVALGYE